MIKILGDIRLADGYFDRGCGVGTCIAQGEDPFAGLKRDTNDFWIGNFECVCADSEKSFVVKPEVIKNLQHLNLYGFANNHAMQIGDDGYTQTIRFFEENSIDFVGSLNRKSTIFKHQGKTVGVIAFSLRPDNFSDSPLYWHLPELSDIEDEINKLSSCDYKIAFVHWGYEFINYPNLGQRQLAHWLIDNGIDLIAGMHPHVAQGIEIYNDKYIFYSLGNAVFNQTWEPTRYGLLLSIDLAGVAPIVDCSYIKTDENGFPSEVESVPDKSGCSFLNTLVGHIQEDELYFQEVSVRASQYRKANHKAIIRRIVRMPVAEQAKMIGDFVARRILHRN